MKTYYFADAEYADNIYGSADPICIDLEEVKSCANGWGITTEELLSQMHEATDAEIREFGTYDH